MPARKGAAAAAGGAGRAPSGGSRGRPEVTPRRAAVRRGPTRGGAPYRGDSGHYPVYSNGRSPYYGYGRYPYYGYGRYPYYGYGYGYPYDAYGYPYYGYPGLSFSFGFGYPYASGYYGYGYPYSAYPGYGYGAAVVVPQGSAYGGVRIQGAPRNVEVYVDGNYAGLVDDADGMFQRLDLQPGQHEIEIRTPGKPLVYDVSVGAGQTVTIHQRCIRVIG